MTSPHMQIECFGPPGSGKTTLCRSIESQALPARVLAGKAFGAYWRSQPRMTRLLALGKAALDMPTHWAIAKIALRSRLWSHPDALRRLCRLPYQRARLGILAQENINIFDQFLLQDIWSIHVSAKIFAPPADDIADLIGALYRGIPIQIIYLPVETAEAVRRIDARTHGNSRFDGENAEANALLLARAEGLFTIILEALQRSSINVHRWPAETAQDRVLALLS